MRAGVIKATAQPSGSPNSSSSVSTEEALRLYAREAAKAVAQAEKRLSKLQEYAQELEAAAQVAEELPQQLSHEVLVPFGKHAFFPGRLIHTNELTMHLGGSYYAERTAANTAAALRRRAATTARSVTHAADELNAHKGRLDLPKAVLDAGGVSGVISTNGSGTPFEIQAALEDDNQMWQEAKLKAAAQAQGRATARAAVFTGVTVEPHKDGNAGTSLPSTSKPSANAVTTTSVDLPPSLVPHQEAGVTNSTATDDAEIARVMAMLARMEALEAAAGAPDEAAAPDSDDEEDNCEDRPDVALAAIQPVTWPGPVLAPTSMVPISTSLLAPSPESVSTDNTSGPSGLHASASGCSAAPGNASAPLTLNKLGGLKRGFFSSPAPCANAAPQAALAPLASSSASAGKLTAGSPLQPPQPPQISPSAPHKPVMGSSTDQQLEAGEISKQAPRRLVEDISDEVFTGCIVEHTPSNQHVVSVPSSSGRLVGEGAMLAAPALQAAYNTGASACAGSLVARGETNTATPIEPPKRVSKFKQRMMEHDL